MNGMFNVTMFLVPHPLGPWGGAKMLNVIKFQLQSQFQRFLNQTLCVFSKMKDLIHIRRNFHLVALVIPQGWDLGVPGVKIFNFLNMVMWYIKFNGMISRPGHT